MSASYAGLGVHCSDSAHSPASEVVEGESHFYASFMSIEGLVDESPAFIKPVEPEIVGIDQLRVQVDSKLRDSRISRYIDAFDLIVDRPAAMNAVEIQALEPLRQRLFGDEITVLQM